MKIIKFADKESIHAHLQEHGAIAFAEVPAPIYHSTKCISYSSLKEMKTSPSKFKWSLDHPRKSSPAMEMGTAIHMALLEPDLFEKTYRLRKKVDGRTKDGKAYNEKWELENQGLVALDEYEIDTVNRVHKRATDSDFFMQFFKPGVRETSFFVHDKPTGLNLRCRPDNFIYEKNIIVDLKTTDCADEHVFNEDIFKFSYDLQAAFYMDVVEAATGRRPDAYVILAIEKSRDCDMNLFFIPEDVLAKRTFEYRRWLSALSDCVKTDVWPGYPRKFIEYRPRRWWADKLEDEMTQAMTEAEVVNS